MGPIKGADVQHFIILDKPMAKVFVYLAKLHFLLKMALILSFVPVFFLIIC